MLAGCGKMQSSELTAKEVLGFLNGGSPKHMGRVSDFGANIITKTMLFWSHYKENIERQNHSSTMRMLLLNAPKGSSLSSQERELPKLSTNF
jgi:hypothetical protein